jgi:TolB protein
MVAHPFPLALPLALASCAPLLPGAALVSAREGSEQNPCLAPDGQTLVFTRFLEGYNEGPAALMALDLGSGEECTLIAAGDHDHVNMPGRCFSPDGYLLAYASDEEERDEVWVLSLVDGESWRVTDRPGAGALEPGFTADGEGLVYESEGRLWHAALDGRGERAITDGSADDRQPSPHPLEDRLVFQSTRGGTWGLWEVSLAGGDPTPLLDEDAEETDPSFSADGGAVAFATDACAGLSCIAAWRGDSTEILAGEPGWYLGAPTQGADGTAWFEASKGDPEETGATAIWRVDP